MQRHDWLAAAHASREALRHDPQSADAYNNLGWSLAQLGFRGDAAQAYRAALSFNPEHERARNNLQLVMAAK
jgi:Flp pilus assembly protein TadD